MNTSDNNRFHGGLKIFVNDGFVYIKDYDSSYAGLLAENDQVLYIGYTDFSLRSDDPELRNKINRLLDDYLLDRWLIIMKPDGNVTRVPLLREKSERFSIWSIFSFLISIATKIE